MDAVGTCFVLQFFPADDDDGNGEGDNDDDDRWGIPPQEDDDGDGEADDAAATTASFLPPPCLSSKTGTRGGGGRMISDSAVFKRVGDVPGRSNNDSRVDEDDLLWVTCCCCCCCCLLTEEDITRFGCRDVCGSSNGGSSLLDCCEGGAKREAMDVVADVGVAGRKAAGPEDFSNDCAIGDDGNPALPSAEFENDDPGVAVAVAAVAVALVDADSGFDGVEIFAVGGTLRGGGSNKEAIVVFVLVVDAIDLWLSLPLPVLVFIFVAGIFGAGGANRESIADDADGIVAAAGRGAANKEDSPPVAVAVAVVVEVAVVFNVGVDVCEPVEDDGDSHSLFPVMHREGGGAKREVMDDDDNDGLLDVIL